MKVDVRWCIHKQVSWVLHGVLRLHDFGEQSALIASKNLPQPLQRTRTNVFDDVETRSCRPCFCAHIVHSCLWFSRASDCFSHWVCALPPPSSSTIHTRMSEATQQQQCKDGLWATGQAWVSQTMWPSLPQRNIVLPVWTQTSYSWRASATKTDPGNRIWTRFKSFIFTPLRTT